MGVTLFLCSFVSPSVTLSSWTTHPTSPRAISSSVPRCAQEVCFCAIGPDVLLLTLEFILRLVSFQESKCGHEEEKRNKAPKEQIQIPAQAGQITHTWASAGFKTDGSTGERILQSGELKILKTEQNINLNYSNQTASKADFP